MKNYIKNAQNISHVASRAVRGRRRYSLLGVLLPLYFISTMFDYVGLIPGVSPARMMAILVLLAAFLRLKTLSLRIDGRVFAIFAVLFGVLISAGTADDFGQNFNQYLSFVLNLLLVLIAASVKLNDAEQRLCLLSFGAGSLIVCLLMLLSSSGVNGTERSSVSILGYMQDPNELCAYFVFPEILLLKYSEGKEARQKIVCYFLVFLFVITALMTGSRGGLLAMLAALIVCVVVMLRRTKSPIWVILSVVAMLLFAVYGVDLILGLLPNSVAVRFTGVTLSDGTAALRIQKWQEVLFAYDQSDIIQKLFGHGFGATMSATSTGLVAHNAYIEALFSLGAFGFVALAWLFVMVFRHVAKAGEYVLYAPLLGFFVLWISLSAISLKVIWSVVMLTFLLDFPVERLMSGMSGARKNKARRWR